MNCVMLRGLMASVDPAISRQRNTWLPYALVAAIVGMTVVTLRWIEGQPWWCSCGQLFPWVSDVWTRHCSRHIADAYTFAHFLHGLFFFTVFALLCPRWPMAWRFCASIALACGWEVLENSSFIINRYRDSTMSVEYLGDGVINSMADVLACALGFAFARRFGIMVAVIAFIAIDVALLLIIRDNLTVGTLMLVFPIESIKQWQLAGHPGP